MSNSKHMPMNMDDLENFSNLFHMVIDGIEEHLENDQPDTEYVISTLLALSRQLDFIVNDVSTEYRETLIKMNLSGSRSDAKEEVV